MVGLANENGEGGHDELVASRQTSYGDGRQWYHVLYVLVDQEETAYIPEDIWICADYVRVSGLSSEDREHIESVRFGILAIRPKELPAFSFGEALVLYRDVAAGSAQYVTVPASTRLTLFGIPYKERRGGRLFVTLWEPLDATCIRELGSLPLDELEARRGYDGEQGVRKWISSLR